MDRAKRVTQAERVLAILFDGDWHTGLELALGNGAPILSHTRRVHELRKAGHEIDIQRVQFGKVTRLAYRLVRP